MGLGRAVGNGVRRLSKVTSEGKEEKEERLDVGVALVIPGRRVVLSVASTSEGCGSSAPKMEPEGKVLDVVSAAASATGEGTGGNECWSSNSVSAFRMRSSKTRPSKEISKKILEEVNAMYLDVNALYNDFIPTKDNVPELSCKLLHGHRVLI